MPAWLDDLIERRRAFDSLLVPAFIDRDPPFRIVPFPQVVFLGSPSGFVHLGIDDANGQLRVGESETTFLPTELAGEPSVEPTFVDLTANYLGDGPPAEVSSVTFYLDEDSMPAAGNFRAVVFRFGGGEGIALDPFSVSGIRIRTVPDFGAVMEGRPGVDAVTMRPRLSPRSAD